MAISQENSANAQQQNNGGVLQSVTGAVGNMYENTSSFVTRKATEAAHAGGDAAQFVADKLKAPESAPGPAEQKSMDMGAEAGRKIDSATTAAAANAESARDTVASSEAVQQAAAAKESAANMASETTSQVAEQAAAAKESAAAKASETKSTMAEQVSLANESATEKAAEVRHQAAEATRTLAAKLDTADEKQQ